jgi:hypothetical protein
MTATDLSSRRTDKLITPLSVMIHDIISERSSTVVWRKLTTEQVGAYQEISREILCAELVDTVDTNSLPDDEQPVHFHQIKEGDYVVRYFNNRYGRTSRFEEGFAHRLGKSSALSPLQWIERGSNREVAQESPQCSHAVKHTVAAKLPVGSLNVVRNAVVVHHEKGTIHTREYAVLVSGCQCQSTLHSWRGITFSGEVYQYATDAHMDSFSTVNVDLRGMVNTAFSGVPLIRHMCLSRS